MQTVTNQLTNPETMEDELREILPMDNDIQTTKSFLDSRHLITLIGNIKSECQVKLQASLGETESGQAHKVGPYKVYNTPFFAASNSHAKMVKDIISYIEERIKKGVNIVPSTMLKKVKDIQAKHMSRKAQHKFDVM